MKDEGAHRGVMGMGRNTRATPERRYTLTECVRSFSILNYITSYGHGKSRAGRRL